jgi:hypothetical protein
MLNNYANFPSLYHYSQLGSALAGLKMERQSKQKKNSCAEGYEIASRLQDGGCFVL